MDDDRLRGGVRSELLREAILKSGDALGIARDESEPAIDQFLEDGRAANARSADVHATNVASVDLGLPEPVPLRDVLEPPPFPVQCLARWQREWVEGEACATQTPVDLAAMLALAVTATCSAPRFRIQVNTTWFEQANIYVCVALPPASRKSAVFRDAIEPLQEFERHAGEAIAAEVDRASAIVRTAERRQRTVEEAAARAKDGDRQSLELELHVATNELRKAKAAVPRPPQLICSDTTQEQLVRLLAENGGAMAMLDAEGCGPIATMLGRYNPSQAPQVEVFLKAHVGDMIRVDRISREGTVIHNPRLTLGLTIQPVVLESFRSEARLRGLGLYGRFWWCVPKSNIGSRLIDPPQIAESVRRDYRRAVRDMLTSEQGRNANQAVLQLSSDAREVLREFENELEPRLGPGGDLAHLSEWAGKLAGSIVRGVGLLHVADELGDLRRTLIPAATMCRAVQIGEYLLAHAERALTPASVDPRILDAEHVLAWIRNTSSREFSKRDLHNALRRSSRFEKADDLDPVLTLLETHHWIRRCEREHQGRPGRPPSPTYRVHPFTQNPHNPQKSPR